MTAQEIYETKLASMSITLTESEITMNLDEVNQSVINYINRDTIPDKLNFVVANMCIDLTRYQQSLKPAAGDTVSLSDVDSLKIGDTNIKLGGKGSKESNAHKLTVDDILMNYKAQLNGVRRMVWS